MKSEIFEVSTLASEVHIHCMDISSLPENPRLDLLDKVEQARADKFKFAIHRQRFLSAHIVLREIFIRYLGKNPVILKTEEGKPYLKEYPALQFNLTHSKNIALLALTLDTPLGVDVEYHHKSHDFMGIAERYFSPVEFEAIQKSDDRHAEFLKIWTRKEAYLKCKGTGITGNLHEEVPVDTRIHDFHPAPDYTAALVMGMTSKMIKFFD